MPIQKRQFHYHEQGSHDEEWYYLARDTETGEVFVIHATAPFKGKETTNRLEIEELLRGHRGTAADTLRQLIGTLVPDK